MTAGVLRCHILVMNRFKNTIRTIGKVVAHDRGNRVVGSDPWLAIYTGPVTASILSEIHTAALIARARVAIPAADALERLALLEKHNPLAGYRRAGVRLVIVRATALAGVRTAALPMLWRVLRTARDLGIQVAMELDESTGIPDAV